MTQQINVANVKTTFTEVQKGAYLKSEVHCINGLFWCWVKVFGPMQDGLLHVNIKVLAKVKREQTFFLELVMCVSSNSNHSWRPCGIKTFLLDQMRPSLYSPLRIITVFRYKYTGQDRGLGITSLQAAQSNERLFQAPLEANCFGSCFAFSLAHALYHNVITTLRYENAAAMEALQWLCGG